MHKNWSSATVWHFSRMLAWVGMLFALMFGYLNLSESDDCQPTVNAGMLDLSCWDKKTPIELQGTWQFHWRSPDRSAQSPENAEATVTMPVPIRWLDAKETLIPAAGTGTYSVVLHASEPVGGLALLPGRGLTDYQVELVSANGELQRLYSNRNSDGVEVIPSNPIFLPVIEDGAKLRLTVKNGEYYSGGIDVPPLIGGISHILQHQNIQYTVAAILLGGYMFFGLYNLVLWLGYRRDIAYFLLAMCCLTLAARVLDTEDLLPVFWHDAPVAIFAEIGWGTYFSLAFWWPLYFLLRFPTFAFKAWTSIYSGMAFIGLLLVFLTPSTVFMEYGINWFRPVNIVGTMILIGMFIWHTRDVDNYSPIEPLSGILVAFATCMDIYLYIIDQRPFVDISNVAFFLFIAGQSFTIARGYSAGLEKQQKLSKELLELNESLEIRVQDRTRELETANMKLTDISQRDELTGLYNRRAFNERLKQEASRHSRYKQPMSMLVIDIDHFKQVNDTFGHSAGDAVLVCLAGVLNDMARENDIIARLGEEEFVVITPGASAQDATTFANRLRENIKKTSVDFEGTELSVSVSIGIAEHKDDVPVEDLFKQADGALYNAKNAGRDRVVVG